MSADASCLHVHVIPQVVDQTLGVYCHDCSDLRVCWMGEHVPEALWNRAVLADPLFKACVESRESVCAICHEPIAKDSP